MKDFLNSSSCFVGIATGEHHIGPMQCKRASSFKSCQENDITHISYLKAVPAQPLPTNATIRSSHNDKLVSQISAEKNLHGRTAAIESLFDLFVASVPQRRSF
jgi:hypothetical protein